MSDDVALLIPCRWTPEEDALLLKAVAKYGTKWSQIRDSGLVPGRHDSQLRERWKCDRVRILTVLLGLGQCYPLRCACAVPPDHLRSEISFSCTCNISNLISYAHRIAYLTLETIRWLCVYMVAQLHAHNWNKHLLGEKFSLREHWLVVTFQQGSENDTGTLHVFMACTLYVLWSTDLLPNTWPPSNFPRLTVKLQKPQRLMRRISSQEDDQMIIAKCRIFASEAAFFSSFATCQFCFSFYRYP